MQHIMAYHLQIAVDMFKNFVGGVVFTSANIWSRNLVTRMTIIHRRLQQQYTYIVNDHYKRRQDLLIAKYIAAMMTSSFHCFRYFTNSLLSTRFKLLF